MEEEEGAAYEIFLAPKRRLGWWQEMPGSQPWMVEWYKERTLMAMTNDWKGSVGDYTAEKYDFGQSFLDHYDWPAADQFKRSDPNEFRHWMEVERQRQHPLIRSAWSEYWDREMDLVQMKDLGLYTIDPLIAFQNSFFWTLRNRLPNERQKSDLKRIKDVIKNNSSGEFSIHNSSANAPFLVFNKD